MKVNELISILQELDQQADIDIATDEDQNQIGDIDTNISEGLTIGGVHSYTLVPVNIIDIGERY